MTNGNKLILDDDWGGKSEETPATAGAPKPSAEVEVDDDWKAQAQREKDELAKKLEAQGGEGGDGQGKPAKADFLSIIESFAYQAMMVLGMVEHPQAPGRAVFDRAQSRYLIDCLIVLRDKTAGNLSKEENDVLTNTVSGLQMAWVEMSEEVARQQAAQATKQAGGGGIVMPGA